MRLGTRWIAGGVLLPLSALANPSGMTWGSYGHDPTFGTDAVSCHARGRSCDAYVGDTSCSRRLPILCISVDGSPNPGIVTGPYNEWAFGNIATTLPVRGETLLSSVDGDAICAESFGVDWRMAEFHDGAGWGFNAWGHVRTDTRFWVHIDDQPANCWD